MAAPGRIPSSSEPTYRVSQLCGEVKEVLNRVFPGVWVAGEVQRVKPSQRGHLYFELIEKDAADGIVARLDAVVWRTDWDRVRRLLLSHGQQLSEGQQIRCRVRPDLWAPAGRLQLVVEEVDPVFTLGLLEMRRRETLAALAAAGLLERNRSLALPLLPLSIGLVTSADSAAYHDFMSTLTESGYGFRVLFVHASVQGRTAEQEITSALGILAALQAKVDCAVLIRGGGARSDLAVFDSRAVAEAVAGVPFPVLTGLGHEIDQSIADRVAHTPLKTPTRVAEFLVERLRSTEAAVIEHRQRLLLAAREPVRQARAALRQAERGLRFAGLRLSGAAARINETARLLSHLGRSRLRQAQERRLRLEAWLVRAAPRAVARRRHEPTVLGQALVARVRDRLAAASIRVEGLERLCVQMSPQRTLARGFSVTRREDGRAVRRAEDVQPGTIVLSELAHGVLRSRTED